jgi:C4-dicarboxylate transporter DctQ subunit
MQAYAFLSKIHLSWAQELCIYMFVWMAKFGAAYGVRTGIHVGVDVLVLALNEVAQMDHPVRSALRRAVHRHHRHHGRKLRLRAVATDQTSPDLELPNWIVYLCIPLGSYLMCFRFAGRVRLLATGDLPHHDHTHVEGIEVDTAVGPTPEGVR